VKHSTPLPLFDSMEHLNDTHDFSYLNKDYFLEDIVVSKKFLNSYKGSKGTFNSYRREVERFIHWTVLVAGKKISQISREDIESYFNFCRQPPKHWIGKTKPPRFIKKEGLRVPNIQWRPFVVTVSKVEHRRGVSPEIDNFSLSYGSLRETLVILGSYFSYLLEEGHVLTNPVALIRQKSKIIRKSQGTTVIRRLTDIQWQYVIETALNLANNNGEQHERTLIIMSSLYSMYLRISELAASERWAPQMNHFARDGDGSWWFTTVGKGNKERNIAVSDAMIAALKRWRMYLALSPLPSPADNTPLLPKIKGSGPISSTNAIRKIVQFCFDKAINKLSEDGFNDEADNLNEATVHWLRHTGISDDVKVRPREHVRDDAGHSSGAITDKYIDIELRERHSSARKKPMSCDD